VKNPFNIFCLIIASTLIGGTIYGITEIFKEEKTYLPVEYDRFIYFPWHAGKGLTPDPTKKEAFFTGSKEKFLEDCSRICTLSHQNYIPAGTTKPVYIQNLYELLNVNPYNLKITLDGYYIYNPLPPTH